MPEYGAVKGWNNRIRIGVSSALNESIWKAGRDPLLNSFSVETGVDIEKISVIGSRQPVSIVEGVTEVSGSIERNLYSKNATYNEFIYVNDSTHYDLLKATGLGGTEGLECKILWNPVSDDVDDGYKRVITNVKFHNYRIAHAARDVVTESVDYDASRLQIIRPGKQMITIIGTNETLSNYQVKIELNPSNFDFSSASIDASDVYFVDSNENYIPYWIESWGDDHAVIWCKVPVIPANTSTHIWMLYGYTAEHPMSDGDSTFEFFDDFEGTSGNTQKGIVEEGAIEETPLSTQNFAQAIHYKKNHDRTYILYIADTFEHRILYFDHDTKSWSSSVKVADCVENDLHENGAIAIDNDGYIYVFYNDHGNMRMKKSINPEDITSWGSAIDPTDGYGTYPKTFVDSSNTIYLLHMHHAESSLNVLSFTKSTDGGNTWASETILVNLDSDCCYAFKAILDSSDNIHVAFSIYDVSEIRRRDVFYMKSTDGGSTWQKADGTSISIPAGEGDVDKAYDSLGYCQGFDLVLDSNNYPIIAYSDQKVYGIVRWTGSAWESHSLGVSTDDEFNNIRLQVITDSTYRAWLLADASTSGRGGEVQVWETTDHGANWTKIRDVTKNSPLLHRDILIPWDYTQEVEAIWNYGSWTTQNGPDCDILFYGSAPPVFIKDVGTAIDTEKWDTLIKGSGSVRKSNGLLTLHPSSNDYDGTVMKTKNSYAANNICVEARIYMDCKRYLQFGFADVTGFSDVSNYWRGTNGYYHFGDTDRNGHIVEMVDENTDPIPAQETTDWPPMQVWFKEAICYLDDGTVKKIKNDSIIETYTDTTWLSDPKRAAISASHWKNYGGDIKVDWFRIRKYADPEPTVIV